MFNLSRRQSMSKIMKKVLVMDVDGTLTDGKLYIGPNGEEFKAFNIKDGYGIKDICGKLGIITVVLTGRQSNIVFRRCEELNISYVHQGVEDKVNKLREISDVLHIPLVDFAYIGDDLNDMGCIQLINKSGGITGCPADGNKEVLDAVTIKCSKSGGCGAVREFIERITCNFDGK